MTYAYTQYNRDIFVRYNKWPLLKNPSFPQLNVTISLFPHTTTTTTRRATSPNKYLRNSLIQNDFTNTTALDRLQPHHYPYSRDAQSGEKERKGGSRNKENVLCKFHMRLIRARTFRKRTHARNKTTPSVDLQFTKSFICNQS